MKVFLFATFLIFINDRSFAQNNFIGFKVGMNASKRYSNFQKNTPTFNFYGGFAANVKLSNKISFQPELVYEPEGNRARFDSDYVNYSSITDHFLQLNAKIRYQFNLSGLSYLYVEAGPSLGYRLFTSSYVEYNGKRTDEQDPLVLSLTEENFSKFSWGAATGIGYNFQINKSRFDVNLTYDMNIISPYYKSKREEFNKPFIEPYYYSLALSIGYYIPINFHESND